MPIYLYNLGYKLSYILICLSLIGIIAVLGAYIGAKLLPKFGSNKILVLADIVDAIAYLMLATLPHISWPLPLIILFKGIQKGLYWPAFHTAFSMNRTVKRTGSQVSLLGTILLAVTAITPAGAGILADKYGLPILYVAGVILMAISAIPLLYGQDDTKGKKLDFSKLNIKDAFRDYSSSFFYSIGLTAQSVIWPLFIFLSLTSYAGVGFAGSLITVSSIFATLYAGKLVQKEKTLLLLKVGALMNSVVAALRIAAYTPLSIFAVNLLNGISSSFVYTPFISRYYQNSDKTSRLEYVIAMEISQFIGWAVYLFILGIAAIFISVNATLILGLFLAVPASYGVKLIR